MWSVEGRRGEEGRGKDGREGGNVCDRVCGVVEGRGAGFVLVDALAKGGLVMSSLCCILATM